MRSRFAGARLHLGALTLFSLLTIALSWPLVAYLSTRVPGMAQWAFDESTFLWNIWTLKRALVEHQISPLHSELIWYPLGIDLILYTYNFFHALLALPLLLAFNLPLASNVALLLSTLLSAYGVFLLVCYLLRFQSSGDRVLAALAAGIVYAFASNRTVYAALGHYDMVTTQWIPFYALMLLRSLDGRLTARSRYRTALLAGIFFALNGLAEMITALFLAIFTLIVLVDYLLRRRTHDVRVDIAADQGAGRLSWGGLALNLLVLGGTAFFFWAPALVPILHQFLTADFSLQGWGEAIPLSTDLLGWFSPTVLHSFFGGDLVAELRRVQLRALEQGVTGFRDVNTVFLGWTTLALATAGALVYRSKLRVWIWTSIIFGLFTLGPFLQINGRYRFDLDGVEATFPMPYALLHYVPIIKANRAPNRNSVLLMLGLAVLAGYGLYWLLARVAAGRARAPVRAIGVLVMALIILEHLSVPLPLSDARIPAVYAQIAADPGAVSVMHVPLGWRDSFGVFGPERTQLQYYQTAHAKPMLGGNISRAPDFKMAYFERLPFFRALTRVEFGNAVSADELAAAQAQAGELMYLYNTAYVLLYPPIPERFPYADHWEDAWEFTRATLPLEDEPFWMQNGIEAYRVIQPQGDDRFALDLGTPGTFPYRGEGWDSLETDSLYDVSASWALGDRSRLFVPLRQVDPDRNYRARVRVRPFAYPGGPEQSVHLLVNGHPFAEKTLIDDWQDLVWQVPGALLIDGLNRFEMRWASSALPRSVLPGSRQIGTTGIQLPVDADLKAYPSGGFIALFDENGDQIDASAGRRGVNVTVLDAKSGEVVDLAGFDTTANAYESQKLAAFLARIPEGAPVLVVSHGDATLFLTDEAVEGVRRLGVDMTVDELRRNHFAFVGVQGAKPGTAAVALDTEEAFLRVSLNRDRRPLAAAVDLLEIGPAP